MTEHPRPLACDETDTLPSLEALIAGTLALMTGYAQSPEESGHRLVMARKRVLQLQTLSQHAGLSAPLRQWGGLQRRMDTVLRAAAAREAALAGENLRLRAELVLLRTSAFWGLGTGRLQSSPRMRPVTARPPQEAHAREAQAVICQTGCMGHAHPWRDADGQCRRSGHACEPLSASGSAAPDAADPDQA